MHFCKSALSLVLLTGSALAHFMHILSPPPGCNLIAGSNITVQVGMNEYPENIDVVAIVLGLAQCYRDKCYPANDKFGNILYQGPFIPMLPHLYANYTITVPNALPVGKASLNLVNLFLIGEGFEPTVQYLNEAVTIVA